MRYFTCLFVFIFFLVACEDELSEEEIPSIVLNSFNSAYPNAEDIEWVKAKEQFEVEFEINNKEHRVIIDTTGEMIKTKQDISFEELPEAIKIIVNTRDTKMALDDIEKIEFASEVFYQLEIGDDRVMYTEKGEVITDAKYWK